MAYSEAGMLRAMRAQLEVTVIVAREDQPMLPFSYGPEGQVEFVSSVMPACTALDELRQPRIWKASHLHHGDVTIAPLTRLEPVITEGEGEDEDVVCGSYQRASLTWISNAHAPVTIYGELVVSIEPADGGDAFPYANLGRAVGWSAVWLHGTVPMGELVELVSNTVHDAPVSFPNPARVRPTTAHSFLQKVLTVEDDMEEDVEEGKNEVEGQANDLTGKSHVRACHVTVDADATTPSDDQIETVRRLIAALSESAAVANSLVLSPRPSPPPSPVSSHYSPRTSSPSSLSANALVDDVAIDDAERVGPHTKREGGVVVPDWGSPVLAAPTSFPGGTLPTPPFNRPPTPYARPSTSASTVSDTLSYVDAPLASNEAVEVFAAVAAAPPLVHSPTIPTSFPLDLDLMHEPVDWSIFSLPPSSSASATSSSSGGTVLEDLAYPYTGNLKQFPEVPVTQLFTTVRSPSVTTLEEEMFGTKEDDRTVIEDGENARGAREHAVRGALTFFRPFLNDTQPSPSTLAPSVTCSPPPTTSFCLPPPSHRIFVHGGALPTVEEALLRRHLSSCVPPAVFCDFLCTRRSLLVAARHAKDLCVALGLGHYIEGQHQLAQDGYRDFVAFLPKPELRGCPFLHPLEELELEVLRAFLDNVHPTESADIFHTITSILDTRAADTEEDELVAQLRIAGALGPIGDVPLPVRGLGF